MDEIDIDLAARLLRVQPRMLLRNIESGALVADDGKISIIAIRAMVGARKEEIASSHGEVDELALQKEKRRSREMEKLIAAKRTEYKRMVAQGLIRPYVSPLHRAKLEAEKEAGLLHFRRKA